MKRIVIKVGTHVLSEQNRLAKQRILNLVELIVELKKRYEIILVSSGAVGAGYQRIKLDKSKIENKQALAAIGQPYLMSVYQKKFSKFNIDTAQILLTAQDFENEKSISNSKKTIDVLLKNNILPIVNENDVTATKELVFGDNDQLSAYVANYFDAELLVILSDISGYYDKNPSKFDDAKLMKNISYISEEELNQKEDANSKFSTGGIVTKLKAANFLMKNNKKMFLASGFDLSSVSDFLQNDISESGTLFQVEN